MRPLLRLALPCLLLLVAARCGPDELAAGFGARVAPPRVHAQAPGGTVRIERKAVRRVIEQPAQNVEGYRQAPLYARLPGYVGRLNKDIGDRVKKGDVLLELSVPEVEADLSQKKAAVGQVLAESRRAEKALAAAEANLRSAAAAVREAEASRQRARAEQARAKSQYERLARAGQSGVLDRESVSESRYSYEAAQAAVGEVEARVKSMKALRDESEARRDTAAAEVEVAKARLKVAEAARDQASAYAGYAKVVAPFDGVVTQRGADEGHFVQPASGASHGTPLMTVDQPDRMRVFVHLPEVEARWIDPAPGEGGAKARVRGQALGGKVLQGRVARAAFGLDPKTRTLRTEVDVANPDRALRPGMFVTVSVEVERPSAWALPASAVRQREGEVWCFVVEDGKARRKALHVGLEGGGLVEVLRVGDAEPTGREAVVANPGAGLKDGDPVN